MLHHYALFALGLIVLVVGAECLIRGSVQIARRCGISPFIVGLTIVGFGTSMPELVVTLSAVANHRPALAVGNVVGSNIANIGLILGLAAIIRPMMARMRMLTTELPIMLGVTVLLWFLLRDNTLSRLDSGILLAAFAAFVVFVIRTAKEESQVVKDELGEVAQAQGPLWRATLLALVGLVGLVGGAELMVDSAVEIARSYGASELMIGLTVVAVGTSLPELASTLSAAVRGQSDIALGNILGSNIFNILFIFGVTGLVSPLKVPDGVLFEEIPVMTLFAFLLLPCLLNGMRIHRWEGAILLAAYIAFVVWQVRTGMR